MVKRFYKTGDYVNEGQILMDLRDDELSKDLFQCEVDMADIEVEILQLEQKIKRANITGYYPELQGKRYFFCLR